MSTFFTYKKKNIRERGAALVLLVMFFVVISVSVLQSVTLVAISELRLYNGLASSKFAYVAAEAGLEDIFYRTITERAVPVSQTLVLNGATSTVTVVNISATEVDVYATGLADRQTRKLYMKVNKNINANFPYGAQVGAGGLQLSNNTTIDGIGLANGDIYSSGQIIGATNVRITGNAISGSSLTADLFASSTVCVTDEVVGRTNPNIDFAQSFMISTSTASPLAKVSLYIKRTGNATGANVHITADNAGVPVTTAIATQALTTALVGTVYGWVDVAFAIPPTLNPGTRYWIVLDATQDSGKYWTWCRSTADNYASHDPYYKQVWNTGGAWTLVPGDMTFALTLGGGVSQIKDIILSGTAKADSIVGATIGGNAHYQTISGSTVASTSYPGSPTPPSIPLPLSSTTIAQWKTDAASGGTITGNCGTGGVAACNTFPLSMGPKKIDGNLIIDGGSALTVNGTLHVTGNVSLMNSSQIRCAFAFQGNSCVIIADGYIRAYNNVVLTGSGVAGSFIMLLTTKQGCLGIAGTGCTTNNSALAVENNVDGALFYTTDSLLDISNNAVVTAVVGYMISLQNGAAINYDPLVSALSFVSSATSTTGAWNANRWNEY